MRRYFSWGCSWTRYENIMYEWGAAPTGDSRSWLTPLNGCVFLGEPQSWALNMVFFAAKIRICGDSIHLWHLWFLIGFVLLTTQFFCARTGWICRVFFCMCLEVTTKFKWDVHICSLGFDQHNRRCCSSERCKHFRRQEPVDLSRLKTPHLEHIKSQKIDILTRVPPCSFILHHVSIIFPIIVPPCVHHFLHHLPSCSMIFPPWFPPCVPWFVHHIFHDFSTICCIIFHHFFHHLPAFLHLSPAHVHPSQPRFGFGRSYRTWPTSCISTAKAPACRWPARWGRLSSGIGWR